LDSKNYLEKAIEGGDPEAPVKEMAQKIAREAPELADLNAWQLEKIARMVVFHRLAEALDGAATRAAIDYPAEKELFLKNAGRSGSRHTRITYRAGLGKLEAYAGRAQLSPLEMTPARADDFIYDLKGSLAPATVRRDVAACSTFFTWLERRHEGLKNPFRGTRARPALRPQKVLEIPDEHEVEIILSAQPPWESAAVAVLALRGLRIGAMPSLTLWGSRFQAHSKGQKLFGELPPRALGAIQALKGIDPHRPFAKILPDTLAHRIAYHTSKLHRQWRIRSNFSCHDFRHFFAVTEYRKNHDLRRLQKLLGHGGLSTTNNYLRSLGEMVD
jgi:site-specific recombinase XerD